MQTVQDPLRDLIARVLYEEDGWPDRDWYELSEQRRVGWREDADRTIKVLQEWFKDGNTIEALDAEVFANASPSRT